MPFRLAGFADEISTDIQVQMDYLRHCEISFCALRGAHGQAVLDWQDFHFPLIKTQFHNRKIKFSCLATQIGAAPVTDPFEGVLERFKLACKRAKQMETKVILMFGGGIPEGSDPAQHKDEVVKRLKVLAEHAKGEGFNVLLENRAGTYCDTADRHAEVLTEAGAPNLMASFDPASYVEAGEDPLAAWPKVQKWVKDIHIHDRNAEGKGALPGKGIGKVKEVLETALGNGWVGLVTLEPGLADNPEFAEMSPEKRYLAAAEAFGEMGLK